MKDLGQRIFELTDAEALDAVNYITNCMQRHAVEIGKLPSRSSILNDKEILKFLDNNFSDIKEQFKQAIANESKKGQIARNILLTLAERRHFISIVEESLDQPALREPFTVSLGASILLLLLLEFDLEYIDKKNGKKLKISKKAPILEIIMKLLGV